jgi:hypothetical protein
MNTNVQEQETRNMEQGADRSDSTLFHVPSCSLFLSSSAEASTVSVVGGRFDSSSTRDRCVSKAACEPAGIRSVVAHIQRTGLPSLLLS